MTRDLLDRRYLGGILPVDAATGTPVGRALALNAERLKLVRTISGVYAISAAAGFEEYTESLDAPDVDPGDLEDPHYRVNVWDPRGDYLPRALTVDLPRAASGPDAVFEPIIVRMYRAPKADISGNWGVVFGRILADGDGKVPAALIRVVRERDGEVLASGMNVSLGADEAPALLARLSESERAETLRNLPSARTLGDFCLPVVGLPLSSWSEEEPPLNPEGEEPVVHDVFASDVSVRLHFYPIAGGALPVDPGDPEGPAESENRSALISVAPGRRVNAGTFQLVV